MANIEILQYWMWPYDTFTFHDCRSQQAHWVPDDPIILRLWLQARGQAEADWEDFGQNAVGVNSWNYLRWPMYVHGRRSSERCGVRHLVYWYEGGWIYHRYSGREWQQWLDRNRYSETTHGALIELRSGLLEDDEGRCDVCGRMFRVCTLASLYNGC
ncbi:hypothetical protein CYMTET_4283 [Cymbomonas tetramitiformis]|uniref:Uncharacterized protein n=1 Tax=Cymbomonas tetramitiformis TaxID=36881 RepID=A0AAE0LK85_9CHLO|nr:hypothetical protein CYMTET_4283 [Cymbomonas tetramitiformis]